MNIIRSRILLLVLPGLVIALGAGAALAFAADAPPLAQAARGLPLPTLIAAALLAWRLRSARLFTASAILAAAYVVLHDRVLGSSLFPQALVLTFLPVGFALLAFMRDRGFTISEVRNNLLIAVAPVVAAAFFAAGRSGVALQLLTRTYIDPAYTDWSALPQLALFTTAWALLVIAVRGLRRLNACEVALWWLVLTTACGLSATPASTTRGMWTIAGALIVIVALVEIAYAFAFNDELTGLPGRRALNFALHSLKAPYAIAIVDVDHFKTFNDTHGHDVGDQVLRMVATRLRAVGGGGVAYRSGGEEFTIVFAGADKRQATEHVEAVRATIAETNFAVRRTPRPRNKRGVQKRGRSGSARDFLQVTISVGVAGATDRSKAVHAVMETADQAMYRAKTAGRNRVVA